MVIHLAVKLFVPGIDKNGKMTMDYIKNKKATQFETSALSSLWI